MTARAQTVTILFTDLVSSTELLQRAGDERAQRIFKAHHRLLSEAVQAHGGHEVKWLGDGLMVAFDSARDAARCAIAMQHASRRPAAGERLEIRVGLHVGDAFVDESDYFGTSVVIARRLCDKADAGQIFASDLVVRLLDGRHEIIFEDLGALALKGIEAPVHAHEVRYEHDPLAMLAVTPFVGREDVIAALSKKLDEARAGKGSLVMLVGEPGIGKTRTAEEFCEHARQAGATVLRGRCYDGEWAAPFSPFMEAIREYASSAPPNELTQRLGADAGVLARIVPMLHEQLPDIAEPPSIPAEGERYRLLEAVGDFFARVAAPRPLVLMLDDLHWADKGTIAMLRQVVRQAPQQKLLLVGAYRDIELDRTHPLADALQTLRRETNYERLVLKGLGAADVGALLNLVAEQDVPEPFVRAIGEETGGNPFFIREVMLHLVEEKKIVQEDGRWITNVSIAEMRIPEGVREVIGRRLSRVSGACGRMLTVASALTAGFSWEVISTVVDLDDALLLDAVDEALVAQLIVERERGRYDFTHALIRHTLYEELSTPRRILLHRQIGEALERLYEGDIEGHLAEVGHHFYQAASGGLVEKAIGYARRAADDATQRVAYDVAVAQYEHALELSAIAGSDESERCRLLIALGEAQWKTGDMEPSSENYGVAAEIARKLGLVHELAVAALGYAGPPEFASGGPEVIALLQDAVEAISSEGDRPYLAMVLARLELAVMSTDTYYVRPLGLTDAMRALRPAVLQHAPDGELSARAVQIAREAGSADALAYALRARGRVLWENAVPTLESREVAEELCSIAESQGDRGLMANARMWLMLELLAVGDIARFEPLWSDHIRLITELHEAFHVYEYGLLDAALSLMRGDLGDAERKAQEALVTGDRAKIPNVMAQFSLQLFPIRREQGRIAELEPIMRPYLEQNPGSSLLASAQAILQLELGHDEETRSAYQPLANERFAQLERDQFLPVTLGLLAEVAGRLSDEQGSAILYDLLLPWRNRQLLPSGGAVAYGSASRQLGILAATLRRWESAEQHFEEALAMNTRMGAKLWVARTQLDYARMLLGRAAAGDVEQATDLLDSALATAREIGMAKVASDCESLLAQ